MYILDTIIFTLFIIIIIIIIIINSVIILNEYIRPIILYTDIIYIYKLYVAIKDYF